jgi:hypothetical protein
MFVVLNFGHGDLIDICALGFKNFWCLEFSQFKNSTGLKHTTRRL